MPPTLPIAFVAPELSDEQWLLVAVWGVGVLGVLISMFGLMLRRLREARSERDAGEHLARIEKQIAALAERGEGLDLRRLEHVLLDIRDGQKRVEERLVAALETRIDGRGAPDITASGGGIAERIVTRLVALGYEKIELVTPGVELEQLAAKGGEVTVEAQKAGAQHKGHVSLRGGAIADVRLRSIYEAFP
ncbi:MAG: hypothetical protein GY711_13455 [bacterium]|nr:hypothetical protein [bacterium]